MRQLNKAAPACCAVVLALAMIATNVHAQAGETTCTKGLGFWKNQTDQWPVQTLTIGTVSYTQEELVSILSQPVRGNGLVLLAREVIVAKLNIAAGVEDDCITTAIAEADAFIGGLVPPPVGDDSVSPSEVSSLKELLEQYNEGELCGADCDDDETTEPEPPAPSPEEPVIDLTVLKTANDDPVNAGESFDYTVTAVNLGPEAAGDVVLTELLPAGVTFTSATPAADSGPNPLVWNIEELTSDPLTFTITVKVGCETTGTLENRVEISTTNTSATELNLDNNVATETVTVIEAPPVVTCPGDIILTPDPDTCTTTFTFEPELSNDCTTVVVETDPTSGTVLGPGITDVFTTVTDALGNVTTCSFTVTVLDCDQLGTCTLGLGYWKNHPDAWPVQSLTIGTQTYTQEQLLSILKQPVRGNGLVQLARTLIVAKLNIANGTNDDCITTAVEAADDFIGNRLVPPVGTARVRPPEVSFLKNVLDAYNEGHLCAPKCDSIEDDGDDEDEKPTYRSNKPGKKAPKQSFRQRSTPIGRLPR